MGEVGTDINGTPKIHIDFSGVKKHSIFILETSFRILLSLWGVSSHFSTSESNVVNLDECDKVYLVTPEL